MNRSHYKKHAVYGPGGRNCPCCGPSPSHRKRHDRRERRREKVIARQEIRFEIESLHLSEDL